jgi:hypothetical protein
MKIDPNRHVFAIGCSSSYGPTFSEDICIADNPNTSMDCYSLLGITYKHPQYAFRTNEAKTFLAGSCKLDEIEVFQKE